LSDPQDAERDEYRALGPLAVLTLIVGLLAPAALVDPLVWSVPLAGLVLGALALRQIARNAPEMTGRTLAVTGLVLSLMFGAAAVTNWYGYRWLVRREARQFAAAWFEALRHGEPHKAHQMIIEPDYRQPLDESLWTFYRDDPAWEGHLRSYVNRPLVHALLVLGERAEVRHYETSGESYAAANKSLYDVYAVTYEEEGKKKTFFVGLHLDRIVLKDGRANWALTRTQTDFVPRGL
jgi:hypothetical protein